MGDVGSQLLGFVLSTVSILGMFKFHAIITFLVPLLALAVPLADTTFAFFRRIIHGQSPFHADKGHFHHRLLAIGLSQKQAVAVLYAASAILGLSAILLTNSNTIKLIIMAVVIVISVAAAIRLYLAHERHLKEQHEQEMAAQNNSASQGNNAPASDAPESN